MVFVGDPRLFFRNRGNQKDILVYIPISGTSSNVCKECKDDEKNLALHILNPKSISDFALGTLTSSECLEGHGVFTCSAAQLRISPLLKQ